MTFKLKNYIMKYVNQPLGGTLTEVERLRKERGLTQQALARAAGVSATTISRMEHPPYRISIESACDVARALGIELGKLYQGGTISYGVGRPVRTGRPINKVKRAEARCITCGTFVSVRERIANTADCHPDAKLKAA